MEFLDPEEKRERTLRLFVGYAIVTTLILFGTFIISFILQGFNIFSTTSDVRNGLLFIDSKPLSADIYINDKQDKRTDARFVLPEGPYAVRLSTDGYRDWQKTVNVIGGSVTYHVYPRLFPINIQKQTTATYQQDPKLWTQSPDRKWIVASASATEPIFNLSDTSSPNNAPVAITFPETVLTKTDVESAKFKVVEWSTDNRRFLLQKTAQDGTVQYVILDREKPEESINLTTRLSLAQNVSVKLRDKKYDQYYLLDASTKLLRRATLTTGIEPVIVADGVVSYASYESNILLYATESGAATGTYAIRIVDGATNYLLQSVAASPIVLLDIAKYESDWFYVVGSNAQNSTKIYLNPLQNSSKTDELGAITPQLSLEITSPRLAGFSTNTRFIAVQNETTFSVYDAELKTSYTFTSPVALPKEGAKWMDGHRLHVTSGNTEHVFEYDGNNYQVLVESKNGYQSFYDRDYVRLFTLAPQTSGALNFQVSNLTLTN
jgi:hypothetical protein